MEVAVETLSASRRQLITHVPAQKVTSVYERVLQRLSTQARIPGFRPGKVPRAMLERRYASYLRDEVVQAVLDEHLHAALTAASAAPLSRPMLTEIGEVRSGRALELRFLYEEFPTIVLRGLDGIDLEIVDIVPDTEDIERELAEQLGAAAAWQSVDEPCADGDGVDVELTLAGEGDRRDDISRSGACGDAEAWWTTLVLGKRAGDALEGEVALPQGETGPLAGQVVHVTGTLVSVRRKVTPSPEELAAQRGLADAAALRADLAAGLEARAKSENLTRRRLLALEALAESSDVEVPEALIEAGIADRCMEMFGGVRMDDTRMSKLMDLLRDALRPQVEMGLRHTLVIDRLAKDLGIEAGDDEVQAAATASQEAEPTPDSGAEAAPDRERVKAGIVRDRALETMIGRMRYRVSTTSPWRERSSWRPQLPKGLSGRGERGHVHGPDCDHGPDGGHVHGPDCDHDHAHDHAPGHSAGA